SDEERRYLRVLWTHFQKNAAWPNLEKLQRAIDRNPDRIDLWVIGSSISYQLARRSWASEQEPSVTVRGAFEVDPRSPELAAFVHLALRCLKLYESEDADPQL